MIKKAVILVLTWMLIGQVLPGFGQQQVSIQVYYDAFGQECSWQIINKINNSVVLSGTAGTSNAFNYNQSISLYPGEYQFKAFDSEGDGWNQGGWYEITPSLGIATGNVSFTSGASQFTDFAVFSSSLTEIGVVSWFNPVTGPGLTATEQVKMKVRNYGTNSLSNFTLSYSINGGFTTVSELYTGILTPGQILTYTFNQTANMQATSSYSCIATVSLTGDNYAANNSLATTVTHVASISAFPWTEQFTSFPPSQWTLSGNQNWVGYQNTAAYCNFFAWENATASMVSPPINLNQATTLNFKWSSFLNDYSLNDKLTVQISTNNQTSWTTIWEKQGNQLFTNDGSTVLTPGTYELASVDLSSYINNLVYLKFIGSNTTYSSNVFIDYVNITANPANDLKVVGLVAPSAASCGLSSSEVIMATIKNVGTNSASGFSVSYSVNGGTAVTETFPWPLGPGQETTHMFATPVNLASPGNYTVNVQVNYPSDLNLSNNSVSTNVQSLAYINSFPFTESFTAAGSNYFYLETNVYSAGSVYTSGNNSMIKLEGGLQNLNPVWIGGSATTTSSLAWQTNTLHLASLSSCQIDATSLNTLELFLDLKQIYRSSNLYSWFRVVVNGTPVADVNGVTDFNPVTSFSDEFTQLHYNLSAYAGSVITLEFQAANKYNSSPFPGNVAYIDNIILRQIPPPDCAVSQIIAPVSGCSLSDTENITIQLVNLGGYELSNLPVSYTFNGMTVSEIVSGTLEPGDTLNYTFTSPADFSQFASSNLTAQVNSPSDAVPGNNSLSALIQNYPLPALSITGLNTSVCIYEQPVTLTGNPAGGTFSGNGISGSVFDPELAGSGTHVITYTYTEPLHGCQNQFTQNVSVIGEPVSFSGFTPAADSIAVLLKVYYNSFYVSQQSWEVLGPDGSVVIPVGAGGSVNGYSYNATIYLEPGVYTFVAHDVAGNGWNNSWYNANPAQGTGTGQVYFTVPAGQTVYTQSTTFTVGANPSYCGSHDPILLTGTPAGGIFSGNGIQGNYFYPAIAGTGNHTINYTYSGSQCVGVSSQVVTVLPANVANLGPDKTVCGQASTNLTLINPGTGSTYLWSTGATTSQISVTQSGNYSITLTSPNACLDYDTIAVSFQPVPQFTFGSDITTCYNQPATLAANFSADSYLWNTGATTSSITTSTAGTYTLTVTVSGCTASDNITLSVDQPQIQITTPQSFCQGSSLTLAAGNTYSGYLWSNAATTSTIQVSTAGTYTVTVSDALGCTVSQAVVVNQNPLPDLNLGPDQTLTNLVIINLGNSYSSILWSDNSTSPVHAFDPGVLGIGVHPFWVQVSNAYGCTRKDTIIFTVNQVYTTQDIILEEGWSIFSMYVQPAALNIATITQSVASDIIILKDGQGNVFWPVNNLNAIGNVEVGEGFQVFMNQQRTLSVNGIQIQPQNTTLTIPQGWSILGYLRTSPASIAQLLSAISANIVIVKDGTGLVYWPSFNYNGIGNMNPGDGYQIKLSAQSNLTYSSNASSLQKLNPERNIPQVYRMNESSENSMTIGIPLNAWDITPELNDEVGIFTPSGMLAGSAVFTGDFMAITCFGDGLLREGLIKENQPYTLRLYQQKSGIEKNLTDIVFAVGDGSYQPNDLEVIKSIHQTQSADRAKLFPNPATNTLSIQYQTKSQEITCELYDNTNKLIRSFSQKQTRSGMMEMSVDIQFLSAGNYFLRIIDGQTSEMYPFVKSNSK